MKSNFKKRRLFVQWEKILPIKCSHSVSIKFLLFVPKHFRENYLEQNVILQSSLNWGVSHVLQNEIKIKLTGNQWWHVTQCQYVTNWHTINTWKASTYVRSKVCFENGRKIAQFHNRKAIWNVMRMWCLHENINKVWTLLFEFKRQEIFVLLYGTRRRESDGVKP